MKKGWNDIKISKLIKAVWNYKEENKTLTEKLTENIKRNGQIESIMIRELDTGFYEVVNGNHRLDVMSHLKIKKAHCYNFGKISEAQARRIAIETNETNFKSDPLKLAGLVKELTTEFNIEELTKTMPYDEAQLNEMIEINDFDWNELSSKSLDDENYKEKYVKINLEASEYTYKLWLDINKKMEKILGYKNEAKVFEFMCAEMNNLPLESIK